MTPVDPSLPLAVAEAPGVAFRRFRGAPDFPAMADAANAAAAADQIDHRTSVEDLSREFAHMPRFDPQSDLILAEAGDQIAGYALGDWWDETNGPRLYGLEVVVRPEWRASPLGRVLLGWLEARMRAIAAGHPPEIPKALTAWFRDTQAFACGLFESAGYPIVRYFLGMVRPSLDDIPDFPLPQGLEVRPALPDHYRAIWEADIEAFRDHWGNAEPSPGDFEAWQENKRYFQPGLWQIAWDTATNEVAGQVRTFIDAEENELFGRKRGYTEFISVRRPYRQQGLARALIVRSLRVQREAGMTESALRVDSDSLTGATRVYEDCGFRVTHRTQVYRKSLDQRSEDAE